MVETTASVPKTHGVTKVSKVTHDSARGPLPRERPQTRSTRGSRV